MTPIAPVAAAVLLLVTPLEGCAGDDDGSLPDRPMHSWSVPKEPSHRVRATCAERDDDLVEGLVRHHWRALVLARDELVQDDPDLRRLVSAVRRAERDVGSGCPQLRPSIPPWMWRSPGW